MPATANKGKGMPATADVGGEQSARRRAAHDAHLPCETPLRGTCPGRQPELSQ